MAFNTIIRLGNVPWNNDYKNVVNFSSLTEQKEQMLKLCTVARYSNRPLKRDSYVDFDEISSDFYNYNYMMYSNATVVDDTNRWWYAFITKVEIIAERTTRVHYITDVWQQFHINELILFKSFVERQHVPVSQDTNSNIRRWVAPEPFNFLPSFSKRIDSFTHDWALRWVMNAVSKVSDGKVEYGGTGASDNMTGVFGWVVSSAAQAQSIIKGYVDGATDHRPDILYMSACPRWAVDVAGGQLIPNNDLSRISSTVSLNGGTLANGYTPINKKLLSSITRAYALYNRNGFCKVLKPELFNGDPTVTLYARPIGLTEVKGTITNYNDLTNSNFTIPYNATLSVAYNANSGSIATLNQISSILGFVGTSAKAVGGVALAVGTGGASEGISTAMKVAGGASAVGSGSGMVADLFNSGKSVYDSFKEQTAGGGSATNTTSLSSDFIKLEFVEINPLPTEVKLADEFLHMYGYAINEVQKPDITNRPHFNYIKTQNVNLKLKSNTEDENLIKTMFNNGMTVWHSVVDFGKSEINDFSDHNR